MKPSNTYFDQIPVAMVKRIATEFQNATEAHDRTSAAQQEAIPQQERWREMAQRVQVENDPQRVTELVEELITAYDDEERRKSDKTSRPGPATKSGGDFRRP